MSKFFIYYAVALVCLLAYYNFNRKIFLDVRDIFDDDGYGGGGFYHK